MTTIRFVEDSSLDLHLPGGRVVSHVHKAGDVVELGESIAQLYLDWQLAVRVPEMERAVAPRGEQR